MLLPNTSEKTFPSSRRTPYRAGPTSQTPYQILVLTPIDQLTHMCGQTLVKYTVKAYLNLNVLECLPEISPKHFKIYQYESCLVCRGTQLSYRMAFPRPHAARAARLPHMPTARGSLNSSRATCRRRPRRIRPGARHGLPVRPWRSVVRTLAEGHCTTAASSASPRRHTDRTAPI
jgi:hypothetical protein